MKTVYYYWAPWCSMCPRVGPMLEKLCDQAGVRLVKVNVDTDPIRPGLAHHTSLPIVDFGTYAISGGQVTSDAIRRGLSR